VFNFFIVIPEIVAALAFGPVIRLLLGENNPNAPLYVVMAGGVFLMVAAALVSRVHDVMRPVPIDAVLAADAKEPFTIPESVQPVPSTGKLPS
jgi:maltose/moltooligosaccharide transporter